MFNTSSTSANIEEIPIVKESEKKNKKIKLSEEDSATLPTESDVFSLISSLFNVKTGRKRGITRLNSSSLLSLCKIFELPLDKKKQVMVEMLNELPLDTVREKFNEHNTNNNSNNNNNISVSLDEVIL